jgi:biotin transport system substrate-specific component
VLGWRNGLLSMSLYVGMGALGMPVFSGGGFGLVRLLGPSGGYLLSFPVAAALVGALLSLRTGRPSETNGTVKRFIMDYGWTLLAMSGGLLLIFLSGTVQLYAVYFHDWTSAFNSGFLIFSGWDLLKLGAAVAISRELHR